MLTRVTLTGADSHTNIHEMIELSTEFPFIEWGILFDAEKDEPRYPSLDWIKRLINVRIYEPTLKSALHLCGTKTNRNFIGQIFRVGPHEFSRIQMNIKADEFNAADIDDACSWSPHQLIITQHNDSNQHLAMNVLSSNHQILFDKSRGAGRSPDVWPAYIESKVCGYAGGLGPEGLLDSLREIEKASNQNPYWIDMETKLRKDDRLSMALCRKVAEQAGQFIKNGG